MDLDRTPPQIANSAAEEIRALNHRTLDPKVFNQPGDVSATADALTTLVQRLPQTLAQLEAGLTALQDRRAIRLDDVPADQVSAKDIHDRVFSVVWELRNAVEALGRVHEHLGKAAGPLSHMGGLWEDDEGEGADA